METSACFAKNVTNRFATAGTVPACKSAYHKERYLLRKEEVSLKKKKYYAENKNAISVRQKAYRQTSSGSRARWAALLRKYNISCEDWAWMFVKQSQKCEVCKQAITVDSANIDHNHQTGKVRALLCLSCNLMLGFAREQPSILLLGAKYLEEHSTNGQCNPDDDAG
jgi:hypothetical protein